MTGNMDKFTKYINEAATQALSLIRGGLESYEEIRLAFGLVRVIKALEAAHKGDLQTACRILESVARYNKTLAQHWAERIREVEKEAKQHG